MGAQRARHLAWRTIGDETVVLDVRRGLVFGLDQPGGEIWHRLDGNSSPAELTEKPDGLDHFLHELGRRGLLEALPPEPPTDSSPPVGSLPRVLWQDRLHDVCQQFSAASRPGQGPGCSGTGGKALDESLPPEP